MHWLLIFYIKDSKVICCITLLLSYSFCMKIS